MNHIHLHRVCINKGCTREVRKAHRCTACIAEGRMDPSGIDYGLTVEQLTAYLIESWSRGKVRSLDKARKKEH